MSLINQMLQDLEKRRASSSERGALPSQVRVLPPEQEARSFWWPLGVTATVLLVGALIWQQRLMKDPAALSGRVDERPAAAAAPAPASRLALTTEPTTLAQSPPAPGIQPGEPPAVVVAEPAFRLAPELEQVPSESNTRSAATRDDTPKPGSSVDRAARRLAPPREVAAKVKPPVATAAVITAAPSAATPAVAAAPQPPGAAPQPPAATVNLAAPPADPKTSSSPGESMIAMKAVALPSGAAPPPAPAAGVKPAVTPKMAGLAPAPASHPSIDKRSQQLSESQLAETEYRDAANLLSQGRLAEAQEAFRLALQHYPTHIGARQGLFGLLVDAKKNAEAERVLQDGLNLNPNLPNFAILLATLQFERGDAAGAIETLQKTAPAAQNSPDYLARLAGLLQRQSRHQEAVAQYQAALKLAPGSGVWQMGLGISLQALNRNAEAQEAFRRAKTTNTLDPDLQAFVDTRMRQLR